MKAEPIVAISIFLMSLLVGFEAWQTVKINELSTEKELLKQEVASISKSVNNVGEDENTLRQLVVDNKNTLEFIKGVLVANEKVAQRESWEDIDGFRF